MCSEMRWFFGLKGVTCFNCGGKDHRGANCRRPDVDECQRNPELGRDEIDMAEMASLSDQVSDQRSSRESRNQGGNGCARSVPPRGGRQTVWLC